MEGARGGWGCDASTGCLLVNEEDFAGSEWAFYCFRLTRISGLRD